MFCWCCRGYGVIGMDFVRKFTIDRWFATRVKAALTFAGHLDMERYVLTRYLIHAFPNINLCELLLK